MAGEVSPAVEDEVGHGIVQVEHGAGVLEDGVTLGDPDVAAVLPEVDILEYMRIRMRVYAGSRGLSACLNHEKDQPFRAVQ